MVVEKGRGYIPVTADLQAARTFAESCAKLHKAVTAKACVVPRQSNVFPAIIVAGKTLLPIVDLEQILQWYYVHEDEIREANLHWKQD
jgi:hypothetical protein